MTSKDNRGSEPTQQYKSRLMMATNRIVEIHILFKLKGYNAAVPLTKPGGPSNRSAHIEVGTKREWSGSNGNKMEDENSSTIYPLFIQVLAPFRIYSQHTQYGIFSYYFDTYYCIVGLPHGIQSYNSLFRRGELTVLEMNWCYWFMQDIYLQ